MILDTPLLPPTTRDGQTIDKDNDKYKGKYNTSKKTNTETNIIDSRHTIASTSDQGWTNHRQRQ